MNENSVNYWFLSFPQVHQFPPIVKSINNVMRKVKETYVLVQFDSSDPSRQSLSPSKCGMRKKR